MKKHEIKTWHQKVFPHATLETQEKRVNDELTEYAEATEKEHQLEELVDAYISYIGMTRFVEKPMYLDKIYKEAKNFADAEFDDALKSKMQKNIERANKGYWTFEENSKEYIAVHKLR